MTNESRIKKVTALLNELGIANRVIQPGFQFDLESMKSEIDYSAVQPTIEQKLQKSRQYLKEAIGSAEE